MKKLALAIFALALSVASACTPASAQTNCLVPSNFPAVPVVSTATESNRVLKASPGCLLALYVTTGATAGYLMIFNSATVPVDGAVTPVGCVYVPVTTSIALNWAPQPPEWYSTGISVAFSTTGCFTKTASATAYFHALVQ